jgi:hypothetical protein
MITHVYPLERGEEAMRIFMAAAPTASGWR